MERFDYVGLLRFVGVITGELRLTADEGAMRLPKLV